MLSWSPGHEGFSPITKCHIRVRLLPGQTAAGRRHCGPHNVVSDECKVKEVSRRKGEVTTTRLINVTAPPFQHEVPGLQAVTRYNVSVSCSNEVGASPVTTWIQSNTTEGGVWVLLATLGVFIAFIYSGFLPSSYFLYCAERFPIQVAVWKAGMFGNRSYMRRSQQGLVTKMPNPLDLCVFPSLKGHIGNSEITFQGWGSSKVPSFPHRRGLFSRMVSTVLGSGRAPNCQKKKKTSMEVFFLSLCNCFSPSLFSVLFFSVPSVFPRNVSVQLNGSRLLISWKPPPDDKINGILRGYDVVVRHGPNMNKVSMFSCEYSSPENTFKSTPSFLLC